MTDKSRQPIVSNFTKALNQRLDNERKSREKDQERQKETRLDQVQNGELARQSKRGPAGFNQAGNDAASSSPSSSRITGLEVPEIDSACVPASSCDPGNHSHSTKTISNATNTRIMSLESKLEIQNTRIRELEAERRSLTIQITDLQRSRDEADDAVLEATVERTADKEQHEEVARSLRVQLQSLKEDRKKADAEIEELTQTVQELRKELAEERCKVDELEVGKQKVGNPDKSEAGSTVAASVAGESTRRMSFGGNKKRLSEPILRFEVYRSDNKEEKKKPGNDRHKEKEKGKKKLDNEGIKAKKKGSQS